MSSQQFLNPITKDKSNEVRFLSHYNMVRTRIVNLKFGISEIGKIIEYIEKIYPQLITTRNEEETIFSDGTIINLKSNEPLINETADKKLYLKDGNFVLNTNTELIINKNEYIFDFLLELIHSENKSDNLSKGKKTIPYLEIHNMGRKMPLIIYFWQQLGLTEALVKFKINYEVTKKTEEIKYLSFKLKDKDLHLFIYPKTRRQELIANGLLTISKNILSLKSEDLSNRQALDTHLNNKYGTETTNMLDLGTETMIDPTTKELLEFQDLPTNIIDLISGTILDKLFDDKVDHPADLTTMRVRQAEVMSHIIYEEIQKAHNRYKMDLNKGISTAQLKLHDENYIIKDLMGQLIQDSAGSDTGGSLINFIEPFSPVDEIVKASRVVKTGKGGIPSKRAFLKAQRNIHPTYLGNISAHSTSEYTDVGSVNSHTLGVSLSNKYGSYGGKKENINEDNWDSLSIDEALIPFVNQMDSVRLILARTHMGQKIPIIDPELPIVETGAEYIVPQLTSTKFLHKAKDDGKVIDVVENENMTIRYDNGKTEILNTLPRYSSTKRTSIIQISLNTLQKGDKFKKGELLAWSKMFKDNSLAQGRNSIMAIMNYKGLSFEDGYAISQTMSDNFITETIQKVSIIIPNNTKILNFVSEINKDTTIRDILLEFEYTSSLESYIENFDTIESELDNDEMMFEEGDNTIKTLSPGGQIIDIRIKLNNQRDLDPIIIDTWKRLNRDIKKKVKSLTKLATTHKDKLVDNLDLSVMKIGNHKIPGKGEVFEGALIEYYIKQPKSLNKGDKLSNRYGAKGVISYILSKEETVKSEFSGDIDIFLAPSSVLGRKNAAIIKELYIGKILYHLPSIVSDKLKKSKDTLDDVKNLILNVYDFLDPTQNKRQIKSIKIKLNSKNIKNLLIDKKIRFNYLIPPFNSPSFENIQDAAKLIKIPLNEKVFIPSLNTWTKQAVPVGINN